MDKRIFDEIRLSAWRLAKSFTCKHLSLKSVTTDDGEVVACQQCSDHWFFRYEDIERAKSSISASGESGK